MPHASRFRNPAGAHPDSTEFRPVFCRRRNSSLATMSLIAGLLSFPMMCLCFFSIPFSLAAIVMGHMARGVVRDTNGQYAGAEMACFGMLLGYASIAITGCVLLFSVVTHSPNVRVTMNTPENDLLLQAEAQLLGQTEQTALGVSLTEDSAADLGRHFIDTLQTLDAAVLAELGHPDDVAGKDYRVFVQRNSDSIAFLLQVPDYEDRSDAEKLELAQSCWLIAQRSVDDILRNSAPLAVAIYSPHSRQRIMMGLKSQVSTVNATPPPPNGDASDLNRFFEVPLRTTK